jgi:hypothetical protein
MKDNSALTAGCREFAKSNIMNLKQREDMTVCTIDLSAPAACGLSKRLFLGGVSAPRK